jgi:cation diffusion facilitator family transporter
VAAEAERARHLARLGLIVNAVLALGKFITGVLGNSYVLIADAVESLADLFSSVVVWSGLTIAARDPNEEYPFGYGKAEAIAALVVGFMLIGAAIGIAIEAVREILTPHHAPAPYTLLVLVLVIIIKWTLARVVSRQAAELESGLVEADAWHHLSDALTSTAAVIGISVALLGGPGWEMADDVAALVAAGIILFNGVRILKAPIADLMDRNPDESLLVAAEQAAHDVPGVRATEKIRARKMGTRYFMEMHVQSDPELSLREAHVLSGKVKTAVRRAVPGVQDVLIHMEPFGE